MKTAWPLLLALILTANAYAETPIEVVPNKGAPINESAVIDQVKSHIDVDKYQSIKAQVVSDTPGVVDSILRKKNFSPSRQPFFAPTKTCSSFLFPIETFTGIKTQQKVLRTRLKRRA
jgi:hypothetical protein